MGRKSKQKKERRVSPDESFSYGPIHVARFGKTVVVENTMSSDEHSALRKKMAAEYDSVVAQIDSMVADIRGLVAKYNPLSILRRSTWASASALIPRESDEDPELDEHTCRRMIDYIQSVIAATPASGPVLPDIDDGSWEQLYELVKKMYSTLNPTFHMVATAKRIENGEDNPELEAFYVKAQMYWTSIRGDRYSVHNMPHLTALLLPHDDEFRKLFDITAKDFLTGLELIQDSLLTGIPKVALEFQQFPIKVFNEFRESGFKSLPGESAADTIQRFIQMRGYEDTQNSIGKRMFEDDLFDVGKLTGWPTALMEELSWRPGQEEEFFASGPFCGWPLRVLPINYRPFLNVDGRYYCYDVLTLMDKIYRVIQKVFSRLDKRYPQTWSERQKVVSESLPFEFFKTLLPGAITDETIYYDDLDGKRCENDGIIACDDSLFVIEVKAGSFTYTDPATDFDAYIKSIKALYLAPHLQAKRLIDALATRGELDIFDADGNKLKTLKFADYHQIVPLCLTLDNMTYLAAQAENLSVLGADLTPLPTWVLSIDDLRVFSEVFKSPVRFSDYAKQRIKAIKSKFAVAEDELAHLGLYLQHNDYAQYAEEFSAPPTWNGYTEVLDVYFHERLVSPTTAVPPMQKSSEYFDKLIAFLDVSDAMGRLALGRRLLDLDDKSRTYLHDGLVDVVTKSRPHQVPFNFFGGTAQLTVLARLPGQKIVTSDEIRKYALAAMLADGKTDWLLVLVDLDGTGAITGVEWEDLDSSMLTPEIEAEIDETRRRLTGEVKEEMALAFSGKHPRNSPCPCGSNLKFKKCHGK
jgi:hypothetical protein